MTSALDQKGLEAAKAAYQQGFVPHEQCLEAAIRAYLSTVIPAEIAEVVDQALDLRDKIMRGKRCVTDTGPAVKPVIELASVHILDDLATLIERLAASQAETRRLALEEAAKWCEDMAAFLAYDAQKTIDEWCTPDIDEEDRRSNYQFARETRDKIPSYQSAARAIRALIDQPSTEGGMDG